MFVVAKKKSRWIQKAIKHPGSLRDQLGIPEGKPIPQSLINSEIAKLRKKRESGHELTEAESTKLKRLNLAKNLRKMNKKKKAEIVDLLVKTSNMLDVMGMLHEANVLDVITEYVVATDGYSIKRACEEEEEEEEETNFSLGGGDTSGTAEMHQTPTHASDKLRSASCGMRIFVYADNGQNQQTKCQCGQLAVPGYNKCQNCLNAQNAQQQATSSQPQQSAAPAAAPPSGAPAQPNTGAVNQQGVVVQPGRGQK